MKRFLAVVWVAGVATLVSACGGGSDKGPPTTTTSPTVALSQANQDVAARAAANAVLGSAEIAKVNPAAAGGTARTGMRSLTEVLARLTQEAVVDRLLAEQGAATAGGPRIQALITRTENCAVSGTVTASLDDRDNSGTPSAGDVFTVTFSQCRPSANDLIDGSIAASYIVVQQSAGSVSATATVSYTNLTATSTAGSFSINGSFSYSLSRVGGVGTAQLLIGPNGLTAGIATAGYSDTITLGAGYAITVTRDPAALPPGSTVPGVTTLTVNGAITATSLGGTIVISTPVAIRQFDIDPFPREGQVQVRGANNGLLVLTVLSTETVRVQLDANGDGTFEVSKDVAWVDLT